MPAVFSVFQQRMLLDYISSSTCLIRMDKEWVNGRSLEECVRFMFEELKLDRDICRDYYDSRDSGTAISFFATFERRCDLRLFNSRLCEFANKVNSCPWGYENLKAANPRHHLRQIYLPSRSRGCRNSVSFFLTASEKNDRPLPAFQVQIINNKRSAVEQGQVTEFPSPPPPPPSVMDADQQPRISHRNAANHISAHVKDNSLKTSETPASDVQNEVPEAANNPHHSVLIRDVDTDFDQNIFESFVGVLRNPAILGARLLENVAHLRLEIKNSDQILERTLAETGRFLQQNVHERNENLKILEELKKTTSKRTWHFKDPIDTSLRLINMYIERVGEATRYEKKKLETSKRIYFNRFLDVK
ncbi:unnamed protein product [Caenorhabditis angaria]|uniref:Uncharacterized protein n=1 Tax=Caenorhabditis angaria TaxID=860376 RepID=A0A9P1IVI2_9PELO|nr:unnamed protein product [Caenorhabditis angaria]